MKRNRPLYQSIAAALQWTRTTSADFADRAKEELEAYLSQLPSGSGIDAGVNLYEAKSNDKRLVFTFAFHHMNDNGYYTHWSYHTMTVTPAFDGIDIKITKGGVRDEHFMEYLYDTFYQNLESIY
jgi:hypothetical protein